LFPPAAPVIIPEPPEIIKPAPMSLSEQIERQQIESANDLVVFIIFFIGGIALLCGSLFISDTKSNIALIVFSLLLLLLTLIIILPIYFKSKSKLKNLLDEQIRGSENQSDLN
ncbi:MAG: hypothetical protein RBS55_07880, partial [Bacteroidales bacterium]|nr:hypothetical protein [Bacteroidales bacterium]